MANNSIPISNVQVSNFAYATDQLLGFSSTVGNDVIIGVANLFTNVALSLGNSTVNTVINSTSYNSGNTTIYTVANSTTDLWIGTTTNSSINSTTLFLGNSIGNTIINSTAFDINDGNNFTSNTSTVTLGNSTVNSIVNSSTLFVQGSSATIGNLSINVGTYQQGNSTVYVTGNSTSDTWVGVNINAVVNATTFWVGNSSVNASVNSTTYSGIALTANNATNLGGVVSTSYVNTAGNYTLTGNIIHSANVTLNTSTNQLVLQGGLGTGNVIVNSTAIYVGNSTANSLINSTALQIAGPATQAANGWTWLPNGMKMNWGTFLANSSSANVVFTSAFGTACLNITLTAGSVVLAGVNTPYVAVAPLTTNAQIRSTGVQNPGVNCYYVAIGY